MKHKTSKQDERDDLPYIDPMSFYDTKGAAKLLGQTENQLRQWRHRSVGPRYQQSTEGGRCQYLGSWLIRFRESIIVEPSAKAGAR